MLKANVGLSRKLSQDFNSTGFSVNLEAEICAPLDDPRMIIERIKELYEVAEESLNQRMERHANLELTPSSLENDSHSATVGSKVRSEDKDQTGSSVEVNRQSDSGFTPATNKQISFLLNLGKRQGLSKPQLENRVASLIGRQADLYELSKKEAGAILDQLTQPSPEPEHQSHN